MQNYLSPSELSTLSHLRFPKRRTQWAAGRLAAKRAAQKMLAATYQKRLELSSIQIGSLESGEPYVRLPSTGPKIDIPISISHSHDLAVAAVGDPLTRIGIDLEKIEIRNPGWLEILLHPSERTSSIEEDPAWQTSLWTLKEALMKLLGTGATVDFWDIRLKSPLSSLTELDGAALEFHGRAHDAWLSLGQPSIRHRTTFFNGYSLTLAYTQLAEPIMGGNYDC